MCAHTKQQAEVVAAACKFKTPAFPSGRRGMFVSRQGYGVKDYYVQANDTVLTVILLENLRFHVEEEGKGVDPEAWS